MEEQSASPAASPPAIPEGETTPLLGRDDDKLPAEKIAAFITDSAMRAEVPFSIPATRMQLLGYQKVRRLSSYSSMLPIILMALSFLETPSWCVGTSPEVDNSWKVFVRTHAVCSIPSDEDKAKRKRGMSYLKNLVSGNTSSFTSGAPPNQASSLTNQPSSLGLAQNLSLAGLSATPSDSVVGYPEGAARKPKPAESKARAQAVSFLEQPPAAAAAERPPVDKTPAQLEEEQLLFTQPYFLSFHVTLMIEVACLVVLTITHVCEFIAWGSDAFRTQNRDQLAINAMLLLDVGVAVTLAPHLRLGTFLRGACFMSYNKGVRRSLQAMVRQMRELISVMLLPAGCICFFGYAMYLIFKDTAQDEYFVDLGTSIRSMFIMQTGADYPERIEAVYRRYRFTAIIMNLFLFLTLVGIGNLILAMVYDAFMSNKKNDTKDFYMTRYKVCDMAFNALAAGGKDPKNLSQDQCMDMLMELREDYGYDINKGFLHCYMKQLDADGNGQIDKKEFRSICNVLQAKIATGLKEDSFVEVHFPKLYKAPFFQMLDKFVPTARFEHITNALVILSGVSVFVDEIEALRPYKDAMGMWDDYLFVTAWFLEMLMRLSVYSWAEYSSSLKHRLDFAVTWGLVFALLYIGLIADSPVANGALKPLMMMRLLRLVALAGSIGDLGVIFETITIVIPGLKVPVVNLFVVVYFFSCLGLAIFGGLIYEGAEGYPYAYTRAGSAPTGSGNVFNMNDFLGATSMLLIICIEGWYSGFPEQMEALTWFTHLVTYPYFVFFYIVTALFVFNVFSALLIDSYLAVEERVKLAALHKNDALPEEVEREGLNLKALQMGWRSHKAMARGDTEAPEVSAFRKLREDLHQQQTMMAFRAFKAKNLSVSEYVDWEAEMFLNADISDSDDEDVLLSMRSAMEEP